MIRVILLIFVGLSVPWHNPVAAGEEWRTNTQLLPQYCKDRAKGTRSAEWTKWRGTLGDVYIHMHHYCNGLYAEQKARTSVDQQERNRRLATVIGQMQYVERHCQPGCVLYPELHTRLGWALGESGQVSEAIEQLQRAIKAKPKYTLAYARLSDLYVK